jgi:hypothetical protein
MDPLILAPLISSDLSLPIGFIFSLTSQSALIIIYPKGKLIFQLRSSFADSISHKET